MRASFLHAALAYAAKGIPVFPLAPGTKIPMKGSHGHKDATKRETVVRARWEMRPGANIGIATGIKSGLVGIDEDTYKGGSAAALHLPPTLTARTPRGGFQYYFRHPGAGYKVPCDTMGQRLSPGIDIKGDGGYALLPPSRVAGTSYTWVDPAVPVADLPPDLWPRMVVQHADPATTNGKQRMPSAAAAPQDGGGEEEPIPDKRRNATLASLAGTMRRRGMSEAEIAAALLVANRDRCQPPLAETEVAKIARSVNRYAPAAVPVQQHTQAPTKGGHYPLLTDTEVEAFTPAQGILGDLLFEDSVAYLFGDSDTWKTFIAVSWALSIATGTKWLGRDVRAGPAIYVPAEGARGVGKRITAWKLRHGYTGRSVNFFVVPMAVNLLDRHSVPTLIEDIQ